MPTRLQLARWLTPVFLTLSLLAALIAGGAVWWWWTFAMRLPSLAGSVPSVVVGALAGLAALNALWSFQAIQLSPEDYRSYHSNVQEKSWRSWVNALLLSPKNAQALHAAALFAGPLMIVAALIQNSYDILSASEMLARPELAQQLLTAVPWVAGVSALVIITKAWMGWTHPTLSSFLWSCRRMALLWSGVYLMLATFSGLVARINSEAPHVLPMLGAIVGVSWWVIDKTLSGFRHDESDWRETEKYPRSSRSSNALLIPQHLSRQSLEYLAEQEAARLMMYAVKNSWSYLNYRLSNDPRAVRWYADYGKIDHMDVQWRMRLHLIGQLIGGETEIERMMYGDGDDTAYSAYHQDRYCHYAELYQACTNIYSNVVDHYTHQVILAPIAQGVLKTSRQQEIQVLQLFLDANTQLHAEITRLILQRVPTKNGFYLCREDRLKDPRNYSA